ncbi:MAG: hypothetical protein V1885_03115 [Candidatus Brennerbacteria bacterium]
MKHPRTEVYAVIAAIFLIGGKLVSLTGNFYAEKWGESAAVVGAAIMLALVIEYGVERLWQHTA